MPLVLFALLIPLLFLVLLPFSIVQRYRVATSRKTARGWVTTVNLFAIAFSVALFLTVTAVTNVWLPGAFMHAVGGLSVGGIVGVVGLALTKWEKTGRALHFTPSRWLVLALTTLIAVRLLYGLWRAWNAWSNSAPGASWLAAAGANGSLAAGAVILGYYFVYWFGVARQIRRRNAVRVLN